MNTQIPPNRLGRPGKYARYEKLLASLPTVMTKRPRYAAGIGLFRGKRGVRVSLKIRLKHDCFYRGRQRKAGMAMEIPLGALSSWTWEQLEAKFRELQGRANRGEPLEAQAVPSFAEWARKYLHRRQNSLRSIELARIHIEKHLIPEFGELPLNEIKLGHINDWLAKRGMLVKPGTVKRELTTLNVLLNDAVNAEILPKNPSKLADSLGPLPGRKRFATKRELPLLLEAAKEDADWMHDYVVWSLHSGMRRGEILAMEWSDVREIDHDHTAVWVRHSKTGKDRYVPCTSAMVNIIKSRQTAWREQRQKADTNSNAGSRQSLEDRVFPIPYITLRRHWQKVLARAGIEDLTFHDLRRTHGTFALIDGIDPKTVADRMGHSSLQMLSNHYAVVVKEAALEAPKRFEEGFDRRLLDEARSPSSK
jgi:integrase